MRGVTPQGEIYTLAHNACDGDSELCGACFAPNPPTLFVNIQQPGLTLAITGPWDWGRCPHFSPGSCCESVKASLDCVATNGSILRV